MDNNPIKRDLNTTTGNVFGNITDIPNLANLMQDPLGTEIVAGLSGPVSMESLPTDTEQVMGQPPQVNFMADGNTMTSLMERIKNLPSWTWLLGAGAVGAGVIAYKKK
tara:strand:+ start:543 stop:866 length:324 start_codon:yes stop_codon:yes gene_type:complete